METANDLTAAQPQISAEQVNNTFDYDEYGQYLDDIEAELSPWQALKDFDDVADQVESDLDSYNEEIMSADKATKRKMAVAAIEAYNLNLLAKDEDFNVRTLALCNREISPTVLDQAVEDASSDDRFTLMVVANNPKTSINTLNRIFDLAGDEQEIQTAILDNPNCDDILRYKVESAREKSIA